MSCFHATAHLASIQCGNRGWLAKSWQIPAGARLSPALPIPTRLTGRFSKTASTTDVHHRRLGACSTAKDIETPAVCSPDFCTRAAVGAGGGQARLLRESHCRSQSPLATTSWTLSVAPGRRPDGWASTCVHGIFRTMKEILDSGAIGQVKPSGCPTSWPGRRLLIFHDWHATRQNGTSLLLQKGSHDIDMIHWRRALIPSVSCLRQPAITRRRPANNDLNLSVCPTKTPASRCSLAESTAPASAPFARKLTWKNNNMVLDGSGGRHQGLLPCNATSPPTTIATTSSSARKGGLENSEPEMKGVGQDPPLQLLPRAGRPHLRDQAGQRHAQRRRSRQICKDFVDMVPGRQRAACPRCGRAHE